MDLSKTPFRFSLALAFTLLIALYPSADANAGGKIFKTVDSNGNVTFTDVPLLLGPQVKHGSIGTAETPETDVSIQPGEANCSVAESSSRQYCATSAGTKNKTSARRTNG